MAMASIMLLAGCADEAPPEVQPEPAEDDDRPELLTQVRYKNETGTTTGLTVDPAPPIIGGTQSHDITVPLGTGRVEALLSWSDPVTLELIMPEGLGSATHESGSGTAKAVVVGPATGDFTIRVRSDLAVMTDYDISIRLAPEDDSASLLAAEAVIGPGQFFEINLQNENGTRMHWAWTSTTDSAFNIHTHFDGEVQYVIEETTTEHSGTYDVVREGGHSFMWENPGNCLLYTSPSPRDGLLSRMPSSA